MLAPRNAILASLPAFAVILLSLWMTQNASAVPRFTDLSQAYRAIAKSGLHCVGDHRDGSIVFGFVVSRTSLSWHEVNQLSKANPAGKQWKDRIWLVKPILANGFREAPISGEPRVWGDLWAYGDPDLLDEIEDKCGGE